MVDWALELLRVVDEGIIDGTVDGFLSSIYILSEFMVSIMKSLHMYAF